MFYIVYWCTSMKFEGTISTEISELGTFDVKDGKSSGVIHVPKKWINSKVIVLFLMEDRGD